MHAMGFDFELWNAPTVQESQLSPEANCGCMIANATGCEPLFKRSTRLMNEFVGDQGQLVRGQRSVYFAYDHEKDQARFPNLSGTPA